MRFHLIGLVLLTSIAVPTFAQRADPVERRINRLEQEMRAVQRKVFPDGRTQFIEPEIRPDVANPALPGSAGDAMAGLTARVDALEGQLRTLTGQIEEQGYRNRQLEDQINSLRSDLQARLDRIEQARAVEPAATVTDNDPVPASVPDRDRPATPGAAADAPATAGAADPAEEAYNAGFRLWNAKRYGEAQQTLEAAAARYPDSRWASWARNLHGRAFLDDGKPATAARIFLANYQENPRGERAADSLYFLGQALTQLNRRSEACRVYNELEEVYPTMRDWIRQRLPEARTAARCTTSAAR